MSLIVPNPPVSVDPYLEGKEFVYTANIAGYNGNGFAVQLGNWSGLSTAAGTIQTPSYATTNAVTAIPREVRRAPAGAAADSPGWGVGVTPGNPNSILFPGALNDSGFKMAMIGGIDANASVKATTEFLFGLSNATGGFPTAATPLSTAANSWFGLYSENGSSDLFIGYKNVGGAVTALTSALALTWGTFQAWRITIECSPKASPAVTKWTLQQATAIGTWSTVSSGSTAAFQPGRVPLGPNFRARKNGVADVLDFWINSVLIKAYTLGSFSLT